MTAARWPLAAAMAALLGAGPGAVAVGGGASALVVTGGSAAQPGPPR